MESIMNHSMKIIFSFCLLTICLLPLSAQEKLQPKALIIMIDGMRADAYDNISMPNLEKLRAGKWQPGYNGAFSATAWDLDDARPNSAPNHAAIATGVTATKHKVFKNGQTKDGNFEEWPSWLARLATSPQHYKTQFLYSWGENKDTAKHPDVPFRKGKDPDNGDYLASLYASPDGGPDATLFFIGEVDHSGHSDGFYPHSQKYINTAIETDVIIGKLLDTIAARPTFAKEDWLILITSDHGGYGKSHGMLGGHANTIPVLMVGKHITQGILPGIPRNYDMPVTALAHFGVDLAPLNLDGHVIGTEVSKIQRRPLTEGLLAYLPFDTETPVNVAPNGLEIAVVGQNIKSGVDGGKLDKCLRIPGGENVRECIVLKNTEYLKLENGNNFTATMWVRLPPTHVGNPAIFSNKDWRNGARPGFVICGARNINNPTNPGVHFNFGRWHDTHRTDMGVYDITPDEWVFYAVTVTPEGVACFCQGHTDGQFYWIVDGSIKDANLDSGMTWNIGQDGSVAYRYNLQGDIDDFALWNRGMSVDELREIFKAGQESHSLGSLLK